MNFDELLEKHVGGFGKYQILYIFLVSILGIPTAYLNLGIVLFAYSPDHHCTIPELFVKEAQQLNVSFKILQDIFIPRDDNGKLSQCLIRSANNVNLTGLIEDAKQNGNKSAGLPVTECSSWTYDKTYFTETIITKWNLVCGQEFFVASMSSLYYAGVMIGLIITSYAADRFGRKVVLVSSNIIRLFTGILDAFSPNIWFFITLRFFIGVSNSACYTSAVILTMECISTKWRAYSGQLVNLSWAVGYITLPLWGMIVRDWFALHLIATVPFIATLSYYWLIDESPRWLYGSNLFRNKRYNKADKIIQAMAKRNGTTNRLPKDLHNVVTVANSSSDGFLLVFSSKKLCLRTIKLYFVWIVTALVYYGLSLSSSDLEGSPYINFLLMGVIELPAYVIAQVGAAHLGRKHINVICLAISGCCLGSVAFLQYHKQNIGWLITTLVLMGKMAMTVVFAAIYCWTAELYPTNFRSAGLSLCSFMCRLGVIAAPYIGMLNSEYNLLVPDLESIYLTIWMCQRELSFLYPAMQKNVNPLIPQTSFATISLFAAVVCLFLPETRGHPLPDSIARAEQLGQPETSDEEKTIPLSASNSFVEDEKNSDDAFTSDEFEMNEAV